MRESKLRDSATEEVLIQYERHLGGGEKDRATMEKYLRDARKFWDYLGGWGVQEPDREQVPECKWYLSEHYKTTSTNSMLTAIDSFFEYLGCEEYKVRLFKTQRAQFCEPGKELTEKEHGQLAQAAERKGDSRMSMLLQTIGDTGIRIGEFRSITVESLEHGRAEIYNKGKSRVVLLPAELMKVLKKCCRRIEITGGDTFIMKNGRPMDQSNINKEVKELGREAGADERKVLLHNLRHLFARTFCRIKKDVARLVDPLGHPNANTT